MSKSHSVHRLLIKGVYVTCFVVTLRGNLILQEKTPTEESADDSEVGLSFFNDLFFRNDSNKAPQSCFFVANHSQHYNRLFKIIETFYANNPKYVVSKLLLHFLRLQIYNVHYTVTFEHFMMSYIIYCVTYVTKVYSETRKGFILYAD